MEQPAIMDVDAISTHSLTRRLTGSGTNSVVGDGISTHSLTRRLTTRFDEGNWKLRISTHSLTRRLTDLYFEWNGNKTFQLTASQGG